ncbi:MAG TPA: hypothetical protein VM487_18640 [Phycisphaerae bacterium]|nr:hypothetical protein [Phycisphaerae bacterium]
MLNRDQILQTQDLPVEVVPVPEWGGEVRVRTLTGAERDEWEVECTRRRAGDRVDIRGVMARLVVRSAMDEEGRPLFTVADVDALNRKSARAIGRLFKVAQRLSGLTDEDVQVVAKNSESDLSDASGSD